MKRFLSLSVLCLALAACVDTTGISATSSKVPHPKANPNALITVLEYGDLQCPACKGGYERVVKPLLEKHAGQMRFEFRQFPLTNIHQYAMVAAEAAECAADQGKFWDFIDLDYTEQDKLNSAQLDTWGQQLGLDMDLYTRCRKSHIKRPTIQAEYDEGVKMGVQGTPTFFVNGVKVESSVEAIEKAMSEATSNVKL